MPVHLSITCQVSKLTTLDSHQGLIDPTSSSSQCVLSVCIVSSVCVQSVFSVFCVLSVSSVSLLSSQCVLSVSSVCLQCLYCLLSVSSVCLQCPQCPHHVLIVSCEPVDSPLLSCLSPGGQQLSLHLLLIFTVNGRPSQILLHLDELWSSQVVLLLLLLLSVQLQHKRHKSGRHDDRKTP